MEKLDRQGQLRGKEWTEIDKTEETERGETGREEMRGVGEAEGCRGGGGGSGVWWR